MRVLDEIARVESVKIRGTVLHTRPFTPELALYLDGNPQGYAACFLDTPTGTRAYRRTLVLEKTPEGLKAWRYVGPLPEIGEDGLAINRGVIKEELHPKVQAEMLSYGARNVHF